MSDLEDVKPKRLPCGCFPLAGAMSSHDCKMTEAVDAIRALIIECIRAGENSTNPVVMAAVGFLEKNGWSYMEWETIERLLHSESKPIDIRALKVGSPPDAGD